MRARGAVLRMAWIGVLAMALPLTPTPAIAAPGGDASQPAALLDAYTLALIVDDDLFSTEDLASVITDPGTYHSPGFLSETTDSSFCGPDWAKDLVTRYFTVRPTGFQMWSVYEQFRDGSFSAPISGSGTENSPGCISGDGGMITAPPPVTGGFHGYEVINVTAAAFDQSGADTGCDPAPPGCFYTSEWIEKAFPGGTFTVPAFFFHYVAASQGLAVNEWKNASCNRGGNQGDIATTAISQPSGAYGCP
jgi:hypothetical protein